MYELHARAGQRVRLGNRFSMSTSLLTARETIFSFSKCSEKMMFPKKSRWNMIFLVSSRKMIVLFSENMIIFFRRKMKDDLSLKNTWIFSSNVLERWSFQKNSTGIWSILLYYLEKWYFFFPKIWSYSLDGKWKIIFLKKIHGNMIFSSNAPKRWSFQKKSHWSMIFLVLSRKMVFNFRII